MLNESYVAINIIDNSNQKILNKTKNNVPILFYWNGKDDLLNDILYYENMINDYIENISYNEYLNIKISYFYFKYNKNSNNENYIENSILLKDYLKFDKINATNIINVILLDKLCKLYKICFKKEIKEIKDINELYLLFKEYFKDKVNKKTIINWIRSELINENNINTNIIINQLNEILKAYG